MQFVKATKTQAKARIALVGPAGSGKTMTALKLATAIADGKRIALIDTEHGSASKYADKFDFDSLQLSSFSPDTYVEAIHAAEDAGYGVLIIDSLSHAWSGKDGALEMVDQAAARQRTENRFTAWRDVTPKHNALVEAIVGSSLHIIGTMRSKTEYIIESVERNGRTIQAPRKVGLAPIQRDGVEYEFDIVGELDADNTLVITKTRLAELTGAVIQKPNGQLGETIKAWLTDGARVIVAPGVFSSPEHAIKWSLDNGAFDGADIAATAYHALKEERKPENAKDMARIWSTEVRRLVAEKQLQQTDFLASSVMPATTGK